MKRGVWHCGSYAITLDVPRVMGIVNVTPDSFSDGGAWLDPDAAIQQGVKLIAAGADILDVGGESTRPGATPVAPEEELRRILPVVRGLAAQCTVPLSVDTLHADVAQEAIAAGASIVNATGWRMNAPAWSRLVVQHGVGICLMHTPELACQLGYDPTVEETCVRDVCASLETALRAAREQGVDAAHCVIDPGIGFGKTTAQNLAILAELEKLAVHAPVLVGASRKRFVGEISQEPEPSQRLGGSIAVAIWSVLRGAAIVRVHDVQATVQALRMVTQLQHLKSHLDGNRVSALSECHG